jgi:hypothetical protein
MQYWHSQLWHFEVLLTLCKRRNLSITGYLGIALRSKEFTIVLWVLCMLSSSGLPSPANDQLPLPPEVLSHAGIDFFPTSPTEEGSSFFNFLPDPVSIRPPTISLFHSLGSITMSTPTTPTTATTTTTAEGLLEAQKVKAIEQIANISKLLRDAIDAALPVAPEQYLTIAVPGTTIDTRDINDNGTFVYDSRPSAFAPTQVMQAEAKLVDNMVPLSYVMVSFLRSFEKSAEILIVCIQIGTTGKSVGRSYTRALDTLVPRKANVSTGKGGGEIRSPGSTEYDQAMKYLTTVDKDTGKTKMDVYIEKQRNWAGARNAWDQAKGAAKSE